MISAYRIAIISIQNLYILLINNALIIRNNNISIEVGITPLCCSAQDHIMVFRISSALSRCPVFT